jgi:glyoxylase I family protein
MKLNRIDHVAIICSDYEKSKKFYTETLGFAIRQEIYRSERNSWKCDLEINGDFQIELFSFPNSSARASHPEACGLRHLAFEVDDFDAVIVELNGKGVATEPVRNDETRNSKRFTFFFDPDGQPLELCEK